MFEKEKSILKFLNVAETNVYVKIIFLRTRTNAYN